MIIIDILIAFLELILSAICWVFRKTKLLGIKYVFWWFTNKRIPITITQTVIFPVRKKEGFNREDVRIIKEIIKNKQTAFSIKDIQIFEDYLQLIIMPDKLAGFLMRIKMIDETIMVEDIFGKEFSDQEETVIEFTTVGRMDFYYRQTDKLETFYEFTEIIIEWLRANKFNNQSPIQNYTIIECNEIIKLKKGEVKRLENGNTVLIKNEKGLKLECNDFSTVKVIKTVKKYFTPVVAS
ncbi:MAG: hypothetical protein ACTSSG_07360 [Candidatus Heimdallarchaeaceae archaeon]